MPKTKSFQNVFLFADSKKTGLQTVSIDTEDPCETWVNISHDGSEISLSLSNWDKLVKLVDQSKKKLKL